MSFLVLICKCRGMLKYHFVFHFKFHLNFEIWRWWNSGRRREAVTLPLQPSRETRGRRTSSSGSVRWSSTNCGGTTESSSAGTKLPGEQPACTCRGFPGEYKQILLQGAEGVAEGDARRAGRVEGAAQLRSARGHQGSAGPTTHLRAAGEHWGISNYSKDTRRCPGTFIIIPNRNKTSNSHAQCLS